MYQKVTLLGNLGSDVELRYLPDGTPVASFSLATNRKWTGKDGQPAEETTWFRISAWGKMAEPCNKYLSKGQQCFVEGQLTPDKETGGPRTYTGNDGQTRASFELRASTVKFLGGGGGHSGNGHAEPNRQPQPEVLTDDQIPF